MDISVLLYKIKENVKLVENGDTSDSLLEEIHSDFLEFMDLIKYFLIQERDTYYGYFLMNMKFKTNFYSNSIAGILLNEYPPVFEANPLMLCKFSLKEIVYIVCHEIDHVVLNHPVEMVKANPDNDPIIFELFNIAADAAVNDRINHEIVTENHQFMSQPDGLITSKTIADICYPAYVKPLESYAYYFNMLKNLPKPYKPSINGAKSIMQHNQQNEKDALSKSRYKSDYVKDSIYQGMGSNVNNGDQKPVVTSKNCVGNIMDHLWEAPGDVDEIADTIREFVNTTVEMINKKSRGLMPAYFMSEVEKLNQPPKISWQKILKKYIGTISANKRSTRMRLNRRQPERFDLSGRMDDKLLKIVVAIDTSGSVNDDMISEILNEIFAILAKRKHEITIIECDAKVQRVYKVKSPANIQNKVAGRGGTCFTPVIELINKEKYYRDALLIYFTDGYGEQEIPRPRTYRNMWVVIGDAQNLSLKEPYGTVLSL